MEQEFSEEYISALLDRNDLSEEEQAGIRRWIEEHPGRVASHAALRFAKECVQHSRPSLVVPTPADVRATILMNLRREATMPHQPVQRARRSVWEALVSRHRLALAILLLVGAGAGMYYTLVNRNTPSASQPDYIEVRQENFRLQSLHTFDVIRQEGFHLHKVSDSFGEMEKFFQKNGVDYYLISPEVEAQLLGGVLSVQNGKKLAHFVFRAGNASVYMVQVPREAFTSHVVNVEDSVLSLVDRGGWYWEQTRHSTLTIWEKDSTVCAIVADLSLEELQTILRIRKDNS